MSSGIALVTGAAGGIGAAVTKRLVENQYTVLALGRHQEALAALQEECPARILPVVFDVTSPQPLWLTGLVNIFSYYDIPPRIDVLVCAHGHPPITNTSSVALSVPMEFGPVIFTDLVGAFTASQAILPYMIRQQSGSIIYISSLHAHQTYPARASYAAAKAGVCGMARSLALEFGKEGIRINTILPWQVDGKRTTMIAHAHEQKTGEDLQSRYLRRSPIHALIPENDIADAALFLINNRSCHGMELVLDGGVSASMWHEDF